MIYTTLFTAALAFSGTVVASTIKPKHPPWSNPGGHALGPPNDKPDQPANPGDTDSDEPTEPTDHKYKSLRQWALGHRKKWGVAVDQNVLEVPANAALVIKEFNQVTPENSMKWDETDDGKPLGAADYVVKFAQEHNMAIRGHTLVWYKQYPKRLDKITDPAKLEKEIHDHITMLVGRYKGKIAVWDVVNEILDENGNLRDSVFSRVLGEKFVHIAFNAAHEADPEARLYINDFNLDDPNYAKTKGMIAKVTKWRNQDKIPIHGIGSQSHIGPGGGNRHAAALKALSAVVDEVAITELDITNAPRDDYVAVVKGCLAIKNCVSLTSWGVDDHVSWMPGKNPLLFDANLKPKPAYNAIMDLP